MIYLDSCALVKLLLPEDETPALRSYLSAHATEGHVTSALAQTEVCRTLVRAGMPQPFFKAAEQMFDRLLRIRISDELLRNAGLFPMSHLRSLDGRELERHEPHARRRQRRGVQRLLQPHHGCG